jgi:hypothetical protein
MNAASNSYLLGLGFGKSHWISSTHASNATGSTAEEKESSQQSNRKKEALSQLSKSTSVLNRKNCHVDLQQDLSGGRR